jgi:hypothetical protein
MVMRPLGGTSGLPGNASFAHSALATVVRDVGASLATSLRTICIVVASVRAAKSAHGMPHITDGEIALRSFRGDRVCDTVVLWLGSGGVSPGWVSPTVHVALLHLPWVHLLVAVQSSSVPGKQGKVVNLKNF